MDFFKFRQNSIIHTDLAEIQHLHYQNKLFVSHLDVEDQGPSLASVVAILPDFDGFLLILPKPNFLYRCISWVQSGGPVTTESIVRFDTWFELFGVFRKNLAPMTLAKMAAEFVGSQNSKWPPVAILEM